MNENSNCGNSDIELTHSLSGYNSGNTEDFSSYYANADTGNKYSSNYSNEAVNIYNNSYSTVTEAVNSYDSSYGTVTEAVNSYDTSYNTEAVNSYDTSYNHEAANKFDGTGSYNYGNTVNNYDSVDNYGNTYGQQAVYNSSSSSYPMAEDFVSRGGRGSRGSRFNSSHGHGDSFRGSDRGFGRGEENDWRSERGQRGHSNFGRGRGNFERGRGNFRGGRGNFEGSRGNFGGGRGNFESGRGDRRDFHANMDGGLERDYGLNIDMRGERFDGGRGCGGVRFPGAPTARPLPPKKPPVVKKPQITSEQQVRMDNAVIKRLVTPKPPHRILTEMMGDSFVFEYIENPPLPPGMVESRVMHTLRTSIEGDISSGTGPSYEIAKAGGETERCHFMMIIWQFS